MEHSSVDHHINGVACNEITLNSADIAVDVPVLVIGGGPTGLLQSYLLSRLGIKSLIVERYPERMGAPKAHALSPRSLEICRQFGLDVRQIRSLGTPRSDAFWVNFVTNLSGESVGVLPYERMDPAVLEETPEMIHNIPQPIFEQFLTQRISEDPNVELRKGVSFVDCKNEPNGVITTVEDRATGHKYRVKSRHVVACDGAKSKVRSHLGIASEGEDSYETMMTIHFNANLRPIVGDHVGMLHWIMDPAAAGFIIGYDLGGNQVLISNFDSDKHPVETWNEDLCRSVVTAAIGCDTQFDILSYRPWILSRKVAKQYRRGNIFLAGDAAHSFPPTGGLGLNSGLADVHNLAYKIAAVHNSSATDSILDSYQADRQMVAEVNSRQSVKNGKMIFGLLKALGTAGISDIAAARENLYASIHDPSKKVMIAEGIENQREHFDNLELHIGYVYGSTEFPQHASHYRPRYVPGARLPHAWITIPSNSSFHPPEAVDLSYVPEFSPEERNTRRFSTLDLCAADRFTFIVSPTTELEAVAEDVNAHFEKIGLGLSVFSVGRDFELIQGSRREAWLHGTGLSDRGGLLLRPDQHILMRLTSSTTAEQAITALNLHLGH